MIPGPKLDYLDFRRFKIVLKYPIVAFLLEGLTDIERTPGAYFGLIISSGSFKLVFLVKHVIS